jgi:uncharacterized protein with FMN-binding domain
MKNSITKYVIGGVIVAAFAAYAIFSSNQNSSSALLPSPSLSSPSLDSNTSSTASSPTPTGQTVGSTSGTPPPTGTNTIVSNGIYKDGTYTGAVADAFYGKLRVVAVVQGGQLTDVQFPTYPNNGGHSLQLSQNDLPILKQEAIAAQSANVNVVSGATQTSQAFEQSLASALAQAK